MCSSQVAVSASSQSRNAPRRGKLEFEPKVSGHRRERGRETKRKEPSGASGQKTCDRKCRCVNIHKSTIKANQEVRKHSTGIKQVDWSGRKTTKPLREERLGINNRGFLCQRTLWKGKTILAGSSARQSSLRSRAFGVAPDIFLLLLGKLINGSAHRPQFQASDFFILCPRNVMDPVLQSLSVLVMVNKPQL